MTIYTVLGPGGYSRAPYGGTNFSGKVTAKPAKMMVGWFDEWPDIKFHYPAHLDAIMALQKSGNMDLGLTKEQRFANAERERQRKITNDWYDDHLQAMLNRIQRKKKR
jgi:hypothetical protein